MLSDIIPNGSGALGAGRVEGQSAVGFEKELAVEGSGRKTSAGQRISFRNCLFRVSGREEGVKRR